jgi:HD-GYP domain-containing protein (c-di-GMP phosphodiesterase class II)
MGLPIMTKRLHLRRTKFKKDEKDYILASDVYSDSILIVPAGTVFNEKIRDVVLGHGIEIVRVYDLDKMRGKAIETDGASGNFQPEILSVPEERREEFNEFVRDYEQMEEDISETLQAVRTGNPINVQRAFDITNNMIVNTKCKSDVFFYMHFMKEFDDHTASHSNNVGILSNIFGRWLKLPSDELVTLTIGGVMHDIGKTVIVTSLTNPAS